VLLLTDGKNEDADRDLGGLLTMLRAEDESARVRVFTIGYGDDADRSTLQRIAEASRAAFYDASKPGTIDRVFRDVVSNF
jgi:Ca-activated chloride channel family protein